MKLARWRVVAVTELGTPVWPPFMRCFTQWGAQRWADRFNYHLSRTPIVGFARYVVCHYTQEKEMPMPTDDGRHVRLPPLSGKELGEMLLALQGHQQSLDSAASLLRETAGLTLSDDGVVLDMTETLAQRFARRQTLVRSLVTMLSEALGDARLVLVPDDEDRP